MDYWSNIEQLKGQTLRTLDRLKPFDVKNVDRTGVLIFIHSSSKERWINYNEINGAWEELFTEGSITRFRIRERHSVANPAYVTAILASLPNVEYEVRPIKLNYIN